MNLGMSDRGKVLSLPVTACYDARTAAEEFK
jgi:hypothetical protein